VNRGVALYGDKVFVGVLDGRLVALNRETGLVEWTVQTTPEQLDYSITGAPRVVLGKVIIGNSGAEYGVRGYITAYDAETGDQVWRFYTVPGNPADGFENEAMERAAETWNGEWWIAGGGGTVWDGYAFDPEANLLYVGTGNGSPWARDFRSPGGGDNLYLSSILAIDPDDGELVWHYQTTPGDDWDYTAVQPMMLLDLVIDGRERSVIVQAPKNGFFYVVDRLTGAFISAEKFADDVTWASAIDYETGRPVENPLARYGATGPVYLSPGPGGAHNWNPMSWNPEAGLVYIPTSSSQMLYSLAAEFEYEPGRTNTGVRFGRGGRGGEAPEAPPLSGNGSVLVARDPVTNTEAWRASGNFSGTLSTGGGLVFAERGGSLVALDASTGEQLWEAQGVGRAATPITYALDGRQYITVLAGSEGGGGRGGRGAGDQDAPQLPTPPRVQTWVLQ
jgi:PQQ-dependent dehydrogenase (methanol/ethanol family)